MTDLHPDLAEIADLLSSEAPPNDLLGNVARFLGRPGYAVANLLRGNPVGAAKNVAQFALDLPTGGFLDRRLSLANLANETGDITTERERPMAGDVARGWGIPIPRSGAASVAFDLVGGLAMDPLTYLTFGGGGLGKGALQGLGRAEAASVLSGALRETSAGRALLGGLAQGADEAASLERALGLGAGKLGATTLAEEHTLLDSLTRGGQLLEGGALRLGEIPLMSNVWGKLGNATLPGAAFRGLEAVAPAQADKLRKATSAAWDFARSNFYDRKLSGAVPEGMHREAVEAGVTITARQRAGELVAQDLVELVPNEQEREGLARVLLAADDAWIAQAWNKPKPERDAMRAAMQAQLEAGLPQEHVLALRKWQDAAAGIAEDMRRAGKWTRLESVWDALTPELREKVAKQAHGVVGAPLDGKSGLQILDEAFDALERGAPKDRAAAQELLGPLHGKILEYGVGLEPIERPFYVPRQMSDAARAAMEVAGRKSAGMFEKTGLPKSVFLKESGATDAEIAQVERTYASADPGAMRARAFEPTRLAPPGTDLEARVAELRARANARAEREGVVSPLPPMAASALPPPPRLAAVDDPVAGVAELDLAKLALRYSDKQAVALGRHQLEQAAKKIGARYGLEATPLDEYVMRQFENVNVPPGKLRKLLRLGNAYYKPALTTMFPAFHARNMVSNVFQTALDPDLGLMDGARALLNVVRNAPAIATGKKLGLEADQALTIMRAGDGDRAARAAVEAMTVGKLSGKEFLRYLDGAVAGRSAGSADLFESASVAQRLGTSPADSMRNPVTWVRAWRDLGTSVGNYVENSFRTHAFMRLLEKGVDPAKAVQRVNKAYVDYAANSVGERALRDAFPFLRYSLAITPTVAEQLARRPGAPMHQVLRTLTTEKEREGPTAPQGTALPLGDGRFMTGLGLPQDAAANLLSAIPTPGRGFEGAREFAAGAAPIPKAVLEATFGRSLFSGQEWGTNRRAPWLLAQIPGATTGRPGPDGETVQEIPGWANELLRALPTSRFSAVVDGLAKDVTDVDRWAKAITGLSRTTIDERKAALRAIGRYLHGQAKAGNAIEARRFFARVAEGEPPPPELAELLEAEAALRKKPKK